MTFLPSLPPDAVLLDLFRAYPETAGPLVDHHRALLRGPSAFTVGERELIAAYVSGLNDCAYCHGVHDATARAFGVPDGLLAALLTDPDRAPVADELRPVLAYVRVLTLTPARVTADDATAVLAAGWAESDLYQAIGICALFNLMNRLVSGTGLHADRAYFSAAAERLAADPEYRAYRENAR
ncbi:carboxymuconolactone decarboxylase family protein [Actinocatenispora rupis]|uniref:Alkyl hydroperoxide reductase AhpD n=1 Tax=Actinocatenispora rupis TaxID=519421 RepID=A0A8J3N7U9_9ACTN|nr:carboxymuconolactone decarboxylase family protein [Actinocatenispora rupis]GID09456.1 alkyl hydroperoxide reductase AhpD [Actinocatenispora rupis]